MTHLKVLLTGAAGRVGSELVPAFWERYDLRLLDREPLPDFPDAIQADLADRDALRNAMTGTDVVVHLAAHPSEAAFVETLVPANIVGVYYVFEAAREAGVRRVVYASSVQTIRGYPPDYTVSVNDPPRPATVYGATKHFGEVLGRWFHEKHGMEFIALRIAAFMSPEKARERADAGNPPDLWTSPCDAVGAFQAAIEAPDIGFAVAFALSHSPSHRADLAPLRDLLGYEPQDRV
ncbi:MAG: NAD(P)-dependent oxidoreductase [Armatimonadaceae bacterium]